MFVLFVWWTNFCLLRTGDVGEERRGDWSHLIPKHFSFAYCENYKNGFSGWPFVYTFLIPLCEAGVLSTLAKAVFKKRWQISCLRIAVIVTQSHGPLVLSDHLKICSFNLFSKENLFYLPSVAQCNSTIYPQLLNGLSFLSLQECRAPYFLQLPGWSKLQ